MAESSADLDAARAAILVAKAARVFIGSIDPALEAERLAEQKKAALKDLSKVPATALRLFVCGDAYAGKTTLLSTFSSLCLQYNGDGPQLYASVKKKIQAQLRFSDKGQARTRGIQVHALQRDGIQLSTWDMAGQSEFHAFHDHMIPDPSNRSAMFMFVWSPVDSQDESRGNVKGEDAFKNSFHYWLRFIAAKTRQSNILRKIIVVLTRQDYIVQGRSAVHASIEALKTSFREIFQVVEVFEVDARKTTSVQPLLSCIFETAKDVLKGVEVFGICAEVSEYLATEPTIKEHGPIMPWVSFSEICANRFNVIDPKIQKAIAYSLNESGCLIYLSHLPFLVLDPNWFCNVVMGSLIHFPHSATAPKRYIPIQGYATLSHLEAILKKIIDWFCNVVMGSLLQFPRSPISASKGYIPIRGYARPSYLEAILMEITHNRVEGHILMGLLEAMHVFCRVPDDGDGKVFVPSSLLDISTSELPLEWRGTSSESFAYAGRRLGCDRTDLTFLTPGLFHTIQVLFNKAFIETKSGSVQLGKDFVFICKEDLQIIVEWGLMKREHVIDVMVRAPDEGDVINYVENNIITTLARVCAQPLGNQGVVLVESVIRPDCLRTPAPLNVREDQCALMVDLLQELRRKLEEGRPYKKLLHVWESTPFEAKHVYNHLIDLIGVELYEKELLSYKMSLQYASRLLQRPSKVGEESLMETAELATHGLTVSQGSGSTSMSVPDHSIEESTKVGEESLMETTELATHSCTVSQGSGSTSMSPDHSIEESTETQVSDGMKEKSSHTRCQDEEDGPFEVTLTKKLARLINRKMESVERDVQIIKSSMESMHGKVDVMDGKLDVIDGKLDAMHAKLDVVHRSILELRNEMLPKILTSVEQSLNFAIENEHGRVPRFVFVTSEGVGLKRRMVTALLPDVTSVRIELFCEHRNSPHRIEGQKGLCVSSVKEGTFVKKALPYVQGFLKVLTVVLKVGAHVAAGAPQSAIPDFSKLIALALDTAGFLESEMLLAKLDGLSCLEDFKGWEEWLVSEITRKKGPNHLHGGIAELFGLKHTRSKDQKVAWLCEKHSSF